MVELPTGTVTLLFSDIEGSTRLLQQLGDRYVEVLAEHHRLLRASFAQFNGREVGTEGDAFFMAFDKANQAVAAAAAAQSALAAHPWPNGVVVQVRMGIHTGEPILVGQDYLGPHGSRPPASRLGRQPNRYTARPHGVAAGRRIGRTRRNLHDGCNGSSC
jgi:class 3 adenylate cyclase